MNLYKIKIYYQMSEEVLIAETSKIRALKKAREKFMLENKNKNIKLMGATVIGVEKLPKINGTLETLPNIKDNIKSNPAIGKLAELPHNPFYEKVSSEL